jgi:hypothetical protein
MGVRRVDAPEADTLHANDWRRVKARGCTDGLPFRGKRFYYQRVPIAWFASASPRNHYSKLVRDGATLDPAEFAQSLHKSGEPWAVG